VNYKYVLELLRGSEAALKNVKQNYERGLTTYDEYLRRSFAIIEEIGELRARFHDAMFE
jgi:hypothetical protein